MLTVTVVNTAVWLVEADARAGEFWFNLGERLRPLRSLALAWNYLGGSVATTVAVTAAVIVLWTTRRRGWAGYLLACTVGGVLIAQSVKHLVDRDRPHFQGALLDPSSPSFPSGHTMGGIYAWGVMGVIALYVFRGRTGTVVGTILVGFGVTLGPSRLILGVHWTSDVVAGWMFGLGWVLIVSAVSLTIVSRRQTSSGDDADPRPEG
jgi:undecaprenyl-diphosphatase